MVEREAQRLKVMRRRQERELHQLVSFEAMRKELQGKAEAKVGRRGLEILPGCYLSSGSGSP
jgi:hypothetical protein